MNMDIIKICEDYQNADIEGVDPEVVIRNADRTINLILKLAQDTKSNESATDGLCPECGGSGGIDSGGMTPWGSAISLPCPSCHEAERMELASIGASWREDSSLKKWFPFTADELELLKERNDVLGKALLEIAKYPVHSEPVGGAFEMQDIASKALGLFPKA